MMDKDAIQLEELLLIASYYSQSNCDKPPGSYADFTFTLWTSLLITIIWGSNSFQEMDSSPELQFVSNPHLKLLDDDVLFHIGIKGGDRQKLRNLFGDVKVSFLVTTFFNYMWILLKWQIHALLPSITLTDLTGSTNSLQQVQKNPSWLWLVDLIHFCFQG